MTWLLVEAFFRKFWPVILLAALIGMVLGYGHYQYQAGQKEVQGRWDASVQRGKGIVEQLKIGQRAITTVTEVVYKDKVKVIHEKGDTIVKQVPVFVRGNADLSGGFRLLYDAAATNTIPDASQIPNAAPVSAEDVATSTTENFTQYYQVKAQLEGLQDWIREQYKNYLEKCKQPAVHCSEGK